jgi:hypothetical protein
MARSIKKGPFVDGHLAKKIDDAVAMAPIWATGAPDGSGDVSRYLAVGSGKEANASGDGGSRSEKLPYDQQGNSKISAD